MKLAISAKTDSIELQRGNGTNRMPLPLSFTLILLAWNARSGFDGRAQEMMGPKQFSWDHFLCNDMINLLTEINKLKGKTNNRHWYVYICWPHKEIDNSGNSGNYILPKMGLELQFVDDVATHFRQIHWQHTPNESTEIVAVANESAKRSKRNEQKREIDENGK